MYSAVITDLRSEIYNRNVIYIYIYIYVCVCVCVCVYIKLYAVSELKFLKFYIFPFSVRM
jgi:hypothetical protein